MYVLCFAAPAVAETTKPMNVVFILADDLGWSDTTLYGTTKLYQTPNIERLAKRGMTFTRAYSNSPLCSPTRASILTGQTPARHGSTTPGHHLKGERLKATVASAASPDKKQLHVQSKTRLDTQYPTLGKLIAGAGYKTAHFGKWHLGHEPYSPLQHGFDIDIPHHPGPGPPGAYVAPWNLKTFKPNSPKEHIEDRMAQEAVKWLKSLPDDQPFYMNYWQFSVHGPWDAKQKLIDKYRKLVDPKNPQRCPTYAAMVESLDDAVGTLLDAVDEAGIADRTVIVFTSDNGGNMYVNVEGEIPTSNAPLRGGKATMYEGGIRVPCIVVWPGVTKPGSRSDEIIQTADFYPTLLNGLHIKQPKDHPKDHTVDGIDIAPALQGGKLNRKAIFTYFPSAPPVPDWLPPSVAVHAGDWKLIRLFHEGENGAHDYRLYDLVKDIGEKKNLAPEHPDKVRQLDRLIEDHLKDANAVVPLPNPKFDPNQYAPEKIGVGRRRTPAKRKAGGDSKARPRAETLFKRRDTNKDGLLTLDEFIGNPKGRNVPALTKQFNRRDTNKDSRLTVQELKAAMKKK
jgi:arylsulfatase A-like enzyme